MKRKQLNLYWFILTVITNILNDIYIFITTGQTRTVLSFLIYWLVAGLGYYFVLFLFCLEEDKE